MDQKKCCHASCDRPRAHHIASKCCFSKQKGDGPERQTFKAYALEAAQELPPAKFKIRDDAKCPGCDRSYGERVTCVLCKAAACRCGRHFGAHTDGDCRDKNESKELIAARRRIEELELAAAGGCAAIAAAECDRLRAQLAMLGKNVPRFMLYSAVLIPLLEDCLTIRLSSSYITTARAKASEMVERIHGKERP